MMDKNSLWKWNNLVDRAGKILQHITQSVPAESAARRVARTSDEVGDRVRHLPVRQQLLRLMPATLVILALGACASSEYMGISLKPGMAAIELQELARRAQAGDKYAQLALGIRLEEGRDVPVDVEHARRLYEMAASDSGGTIWVYSPPVSHDTKGRVIPITLGQKHVGLQEAKERIKAISKKSQ